MTNQNQRDSVEISQSDFKDKDTTPALSFPKPTGNYAVGTTTYEFSDRQREEIYTEDPNDNREITAKVWYPSEKVPGASTAPYMSEELSQAVASELGLPPQDFLNLTQSIQTNSVTDAPVANAKSEYPVLFFSHGGADLPELHSIKAEELASQGYVVVAINHAYDSTANVFSDGRVVPQSSIFDIATRDRETPPEIDARSVNITAADQFWIAVAETPTSPNIITDYNPTEDVIGVAGLGIGFDRLNLTSQGDDVLIQTADSDLAIFKGITPDSLNGNRSHPPLRGAIAV